MKSLKKALETKKLTIGSWITLAHTSIAEIMAKCGFDWLVVDMEHSAITLDQAQSLIQTIELCGIPPLVRVGENNPTLIKRVMDAGAHGVIVPMVNTKEDAIMAVKAVKYPPLGTRGVGLARAQGYGMDFKRYKEWVNKESVVVVQIEHVKAVENLEEILNTEGVDGFIVGPYDLSGSIGKPGDFDDTQVKSLLKKIAQVSRKCNIASGFHVVQPDTKEFAQKVNEGCTFLAFSLDTLLLGTKCKNALSEIKTSCHEKNLKDVRLQ